jgi:hypothetical protein
MKKVLLGLLGIALLASCTENKMFFLALMEAASFLVRALVRTKKIQRTAGVNAIKSRKICAPKNKKRNFADLSNY